MIGGTVLIKGHSIRKIENDCTKGQFMSEVWLKYKQHMFTSSPGIHVKPAYDGST